MPHNSLVQSVQRAFDIIEVVSQSQTGLSLREICSSLGLKQPTAHNLIRTLVARGVLERASAPIRYRLGSTVWQLAAQHTSHAIARAASDVINRFFAQIRAKLPSKIDPDAEAAVTFARWIGGEIVMALRLRLQHPGVMERPMKPYGPYQSAAALTFQAYLPSDDLRTFWRRHPAAEFGGHVWKSERHLLDFLQHVRDVGYARPPFYTDEQFRVAVPVFGPGRQIIGALGLGIWLELDPAQRRAFIHQLQLAAKQISDSLEQFVITP